MSLAEAKRIGTDVESLAISELESVEESTDPNAHYDARTTSLLCPSLETSTVPVLFGGIPLVESGTRVEIKGTKKTVSNGPNRTTEGRWYFKGRDDGQHGSLVESGSMYLLAVHSDSPSGERVILALAVVPASLVDEHLRGRWTETSRREGTTAKLSWSHIFGSAGLV